MSFSEYDDLVEDEVIFNGLWGRRETLGSPSENEVRAVLLVRELSPTAMF